MLEDDYIKINKNICEEKKSARQKESRGNEADRKRKDNKNQEKTKSNIHV